MANKKKKSNNSQNKAEEPKAEEPKNPTTLSQVKKMGMQRQFCAIDNGRRLKHMKLGYIIINDCN